MWRYTSGVVLVGLLAGASLAFGPSYGSQEMGSWRPRAVVPQASPSVADLPVVSSPATTAPSQGVSASSFSGGAAEVVAQLLAGEPDAACHTRRHDAGAYLAQIGERLADVAKIDGFQGCNWGLVHGFVEGALSQVTAVSFPQDAQEICSGLIGDLEGNCHHGLGHGAYRASDGDVLVALDICDSYTLGRNGCGDGVMMEFAEQAPTDPELLDVAWDLCRAIDDSTYKSKCHLYAGFLWWHTAQGDPEALLSNCELGFRDCGVGVGRALVMQDFDAAATIELCALSADGAIARGCAFGVGEQVALFAGTGQIDGAAPGDEDDICAAAIEGLREECRAGAAHYRTALA